MYLGQRCQQHSIAVMLCVQVNDVTAIVAVWSIQVNNECKRLVVCLRVCLGRDRYYASKLEIMPGDEDGRKTVVKHYLEVYNTAIQQSEYFHNGRNISDVLYNNDALLLSVEVYDSSKVVSF